MPSLKISISDLKNVYVNIFALYFSVPNQLALKEDYENDSKSLGICFLCCVLNERSDVSQLNKQTNSEQFTN